MSTRKVTNEDMYDVYHRSFILSDDMDSLENLFNGTGTSLLPMITDENGKSVSEKVEALAKDILESYRHYLEINNTEFPEWKEEMYSCFLYCAMQMYREKRNRYNPVMANMEIPGTFNAIIDAAKSVRTDRRSFESFRDFFAKVYASYRVGSIVSGDFDEKTETGRIVLSDFCKNGQKALKELGFNQWYDELMIFEPPSSLHMELCEKFEAEHKADEADEQTNEEYDDGYYEMLSSLPDHYRYQIELSNKTSEIISQNNKTEADADNWYRWLAKDAEGFNKAYKEAKKEADEKISPNYKEMAYYETMAYEGSWEQAEDERRAEQKAKLRELGRTKSYKEYDKYEIFKDCYQDDIDNLWRSIDYDVEREKQDTWLKFVSDDKNLLKERFAKFVRLYYDHGSPDYFAANVKDMVMSYLIEHNLCPMTFGDDYWLITHKLETAAGMISNEIKRVGRRL